MSLAARPREAHVAHWPFLALVATALVLPRLVLQASGPDAQLSLMMDDASYYLEAARRAFESHSWPTMDGLHPTNGFHPLYMLIVVTLTACFGGEPRTVIPAVFAFNLLCNAAAVVAVARIAVFKPFGSRPAGYFAVALLAMSPGWLVHGTIGVENSLAALTTLAVVLRWDQRYGHGPSRMESSWRATGVDGLLLGVAMLARSDAAILALVWACTAWWSRRRSGGWGAASAEAGLLGLVTLLVVLPWWTANLIRFGTIAQDSAVALAARFASDYGPHTSPLSLRVEAVGVAFWLYRFLWAGGLLPLTAWLLGVAAPIERWRHETRTRWASYCALALGVTSLFLRANDPTDVRSVTEAAMELAMGAIAFAGGLVTTRPSAARMRAVDFFALSAAALAVLAYAIGFRGFQVWYATGYSLVAIVMPAWRALPEMLERRHRLAAGWLIVGALQCVLVVQGWWVRGGREGMDRSLLAHGVELRERMTSFAQASPTPVKWGSFDSGDFSYRVHPLPIVNTDGVMNHAAAVAIREGRLARWMYAEGVTHLVTSELRVRQYSHVEPLPAVRDSAASAAIGLEVWVLRRDSAAAGSRR